MKEKFKVKSVVNKNDLIEKFKAGEEAIIPTSDLSLEVNGQLIQFEFIREEAETEYKFDPIYIDEGVYDLVPTQSGIKPVRMEIREERLLESFSNTKNILKEFNNFYDRLEVYEELGLDKKRGLLLYGPPGTGKTKSITTAIQELQKQNDLVVINWKSDVLDSASVMSFFCNVLRFKGNAKRLLVIIEDIGTTHDGGGSMVRRVDSSMLNFLDGVGINFLLPTFIVATTNHPENLAESLLNRPGRFDEWIHVGYPDATERIALAEFIGKSELSEEDKDALKNTEKMNITASHIKEIIIRAKRDGVTLAQAIKKMKEHQEKFKMIKSGRLGL